MFWPKKLLIFLLLIPFQTVGNVFGAIYLKPGDRGEFVFTVVNSSSSVDFIAPQIIYENQPWWFNMGGLSVLSHDPIAQNTSCQLLIDYTIAENAPSAVTSLDFKVMFATPHVYPSEWFPAQNGNSATVVIDPTPPLLAVIQPKWLGYSASTTIMPTDGIMKIVRGTGASFYASDAESGIVDFQIYNSSGENLAAEYFAQQSGDVSYSGNFTEDLYNVTTLNKAGSSTTGKFYIDHTPVVLVSSFTTLEVSSGNYTDTFALAAQSHWGLGVIKLLPATFTVPDFLDLTAFDTAPAVREYNGNGASSATFTFQDVPDGEYVLYAKNSLGSLSVSPVSIHSITNFNPGTGLYEHVVEYLNPDSSLNNDSGITLSFNNNEKLVFHITYDSVTLNGLTFINSFPVDLPQEIINSYFTFPYSLGFNPKTSTEFTGNVYIKIDYRQSPFTQYQQENARLYAFNGAGWVNITSEAGSGWVKGTTAALSKMVLVFPYVAPQPYTVKSENLVDGEAEAELTSYFLSAALNTAATEQAPISVFISSAEASGKYQVSDIFAFAGSGTELVPPGTFKFRYSVSQLARVGVNAQTLSMYCFFDGLLQTMPDVTMDGYSITALLSAVPQVCGLFSTTKPIVPDLVAPESVMQYVGIAYYSQDGKDYMGSDAHISLISYDSAQSDVAASGVKAVYYGADVSSTSLTGALGGDFSAFIVYKSTFNLLEGSHTITYFVVDNAGNVELPKQTTTYVDYSSPETSLALSENQYIGTGMLYTNGVSSITLNSADPEYDGAASGVKSVKVLLGINRDECQPDTPYYPLAPFGSCANQSYNGPFSVSGGSYTLHYWAEDNVGNRENENLQEVFVDTAAPVTSLYVDGVLVEGPSWTIIQGSSITLMAIDPVVSGNAAGLKGIGLLIDPMSPTCSSTPTYSGAQGTCDNPAYSTPFTLEPGTHTIYYFSLDNVGNSEAAKTLSINSIGAADVTPPETTLSFNGIAVSTIATVNAVTTDTIAITAIDPFVDGLASGVKAVYYLIDVTTTSCLIPPDLTGPAGTCRNPLYSGPFTLEVGTHTVYYTAEDNAGNEAPLKSANISVWNSSVICGGTVMENTILSADLDCSAVTGVALTINADNVFLDGNNHKVIAPNAVWVVNANDRTNITVKNVDLSGNSGLRQGTGLRISYSKGSLIENVTAHNRDVGLSIASGNNNSILRNNNLSNNRSALQVGGATMTLTGNNLSNSVVGLSAGGSNLILGNGNDFSGSTTAVVLVNLTDSVIENLTLNNPKAILGGSSKRLIFRNLDLSGLGGIGLEFNYTEDGVYENITAHNRDIGMNIAGGNSNSIIRNNNLSANKIALQVGGSSMTISGNILSNSVSGLSAGGSNLILKSDNDFSGSTTAVVLVNLTDSVVENLVLNNPKAVLGGSSKRLMFRNLDLSGSGGIGLEFNYTEDSVYENITAHNRDIGMNISGGNSNSIIRNNNLSANKTALQVGGSSMTISGNILSNSVSGLSAGGSNLILKSDNDFSGSTAAVVLVNLTDSVIENLVLNNPKAIWGGASKRLVFRNLDLSGIGGSGLEFNYTENSIYENITAHNRDTGLNISYGNKDSIIRNNNLSHNNIALQVTGTTLTVINNKLDSSTLGLNAMNVYNLVISTGNDFGGSTTAISIGIGEGVVLEDLILNNPLAVNIYRSKTITLRNVNLSGPAGTAVGTGMRVSDSSNVNITGALVVNRDIGIKMDGVCTGNLVANNTVANNNTGLLLMQPCSGVSIVNSVIWGNLDDLQDQTGLNQVSYSNVQEALLPGEGNIHADPLFVDVAAGDYRLRTGSPGIDAGTNTVAGLPVADLDGNFRIVDGNDDGNAVIDMGAYESQAMLPIIIDISPSSGPVSSTFTIHGRGFGAYTAATSRVFIGTTSASIMSWASTAIQGTVPDVLIPGIYSVVAERELNGSLVQTSTVSFTVVSIVSVSSDGLVSITTPEAKLSVTAISTETLPSTATVFSAMSGAGLEPVLGSFYELEPSGIQFTAPAKLAFTFNPVAIDTATVAIYYYDNVGLVWTSATIYNQRITFNPDGSATVEGEIYHTSLYALLRVSPVSPVMLDLSPEVLNIKSKGEAITAVLNTANSATGCFKRDTIKIYKVNGQSLAHPVFAQMQKGKEYTLDCGSATVKFGREAVIAVLPVNAVATITVSGGFTDGRIFQAEDTIRTINPVRASETGDSFAVSADSLFRLGEVYVYPNPVRGGKAPTFHIEVGVADAVRIKIYTVAGQFIHEKILTGAPQVVGAAYAYEYTWEGRIAPGMYNYAIEAGKAGRKLTKGGMFAVLR